MPTLLQEWEDVNRCILCASSRLKPKNKYAQQCLQCGLVFMSPRPSQSLITKHYARHAHFTPWIKEEAGRARLWHRRLAYVKKFIQGGTLLDIGSGTGEFLFTARKDFDGIGTEVSPAGIRVGREKYGVTIRLSPFEDAGFQAGRFNLVTLWHTLEHVPCPHETIEEIHRVLKPGGLVVIAVPNAAWFTWSHAMMLPRNGAKFLLNQVGRRYSYDRLYTPIRLKDDEEIHLSHFSPGVLSRYIGANGFKVLDLTLDPYPARFDAGRRLLFNLCRRAHALTSHNFYPALLLVAAKE